MNLKDLMIDTKSVWVDFPGCKGFEIQVATLSRKELTKLRKNCLIHKFDRKTRVPVEELDEEKFVSEFTKATVKDWKGLTLTHLESLVLIDIPEGKEEEELPYSEENAEMLVSSSSEFDNYLNDVVFDIQRFQGK